MTGHPCPPILLNFRNPLETDSPPPPIEGMGIAANGDTTTVPNGGAQSGLSREESAKEESPGASLVGEIITPKSISFDGFWTASGMVGEIGPAMAAWGKLRDPERAAIWDMICRNGAINTEGMWACTWLKNRGWEWLRPIDQPALRMMDFGPQMAIFSREDEAEQALANGAPILVPYSDEWWAARNWSVAVGQSVYVMDKWAERNKGWPAICSA